MNAAILISNQTNSKWLTEKILEGYWASFSWAQKKKTGILSQTEIERFLEEEELHDNRFLTNQNTQSLKSMSSGERKNALLQHLLDKDISSLIVVNPYDNLDVEKVQELRKRLNALSKEINLIQLLTRSKDALDSTTSFYLLEGEQLIGVDSFKDLALKKDENSLTNSIPEPLLEIDVPTNTLVTFKNINVSFEGRQVLQNINWVIKKGEFWCLKGPNGSGKSTLLNMITGDSHKGYGQNLTLFGQKKGSGESVWDIKELVGYFTPAMVDRFRGYHTLENMLISGLHDSIGLYQIPSEIEKTIAKKWLDLLQLSHKSSFYFQELSQGERRLIMTARAMVKHPPLLILDEPTVGLDDATASFFVSLVNEFAKTSSSAVLFVSHRKENGLSPDKIFELKPDTKGSVGEIHYF